jgi:transcriptional regulator with XRE-family HTH domain
MTSEGLLKIIRKERIRQGVSLRELGKKIGVSGQYLSMIERGRSPLKMNDYYKICQALNVSPASMLMKEEDKKERESFAEKLYALSQRDFYIVMKIIELMQ